MFPQDNKKLLQNRFNPWRNNILGKRRKRFWKTDKNKDDKDTHVLNRIFYYERMN